MECITGKEIPADMVVNHINGIKTDNAKYNLEIVTYSENTQHAFRLGLCNPKKGELNGNCTISEETARGIIRLIVNTNQSNEDIAKLFSISAKHVSSIRHQRRWSHLFDEPEFSGYESSNAFRFSQEDLEKQLKIIHFAETTSMSNSAIANLFNVDRSTVSRVRSKTLYRKAFEVYKQESSTTIENLMSQSELVEYSQVAGSGSTSTDV